MSITRLTVSGFKSIATEQSIDIRPLTLLAGANSSGKSSMMQPLLLLKQTLEAPYDPGPLLLLGPNVRFTSADQVLSRSGKSRGTETFSAGVTIGGGITFVPYFTRQPKRGFVLDRMRLTLDSWEGWLKEGMTSDDLQRSIIDAVRSSVVELELLPELQLVVGRDRCFLELNWMGRIDRPWFEVMGDEGIKPEAERVKRLIRRVIHVPGLRGNPERAYPVSAVGAEFPGTFENYAASLIAQWQLESQPENLEALNDDMARLGLTSKVVGRPVNDTQIEIQVSRRPQAARGGANDLVNIADVGFGVSQTLPVVAALHAAEPGQLVYLEQPEIHLHPRAQWAMAHVLAAAAKREAVLVVETHSSLLLRGIQTLVARGELAPAKVGLHWFTRDPRNGNTRIQTAELDEAGAFGDWPVDFDDVTLDAEGAYLDAAEMATGS